MQKLLPDIEERGDESHGVCSVGLENELPVEEGEEAGLQEAGVKVEKFFMKLASWCEMQDLKSRDT